MANLSLNELKIIAKIRAIKRYERVSEDKLLSALNKSEQGENIREIRKENLDEDKILRHLDFIFDPEKDHYELKKTVSAFNNNYIQNASMGVKDKNISIEEYTDAIRPYLSDI